MAHLITSDLAPQCLASSFDVHGAGDKRIEAQKKRWEEKEKSVNRPPIICPHSRALAAKTGDEPPARLQCSLTAVLLPADLIVR